MLRLSRGVGYNGTQQVMVRACQGMMGDGEGTTKDTKGWQGDVKDAKLMLGNVKECWGTLKILGTIKNVGPICFIVFLTLLKHISVTPTIFYYPWTFPLFPTIPQI
jgi:hypothetical protein